MMKCFARMVMLIGFLVGFISINAFAGEGLLMNGAGATFPYPLYSKWFHHYEQMYPGVKFNYQSIGSGGGIRQILEKTVDFGASDAPMEDADLQKAEGSKILHIPTVIGAVAVAYHVPGVSKGLKLTGSVVAEMFMGKITKWNDPKIQELNKEVHLPNKDILPVRRSDGSGTTFIFTEYLSKVSPDWSDNVGTGKSVSWPVGIGAKGNEGVTGLVKQTPGAIGYMELAYAIKNNVAVASIKNKAGNFVEPTTVSVSAAATNVTLPQDYRVSLTNSEGTKAYPLSAFTYLLIYEKQHDTQKGKAMVEFLKWATHDGQKFASELHYSPLPSSVALKLDETISHIQVGK
ncbi:MAG: phosphate ABC transporter substrate-binding protein PstS [Deltaproteobacteria bacterium RIFCSPLOWO2_02_FULL_44_10]|nr:MAG: phosphate ABC transporter substrate-binding protein PstS [Deltaproteobacteria bacterium RIFCSPHIGHO2_02_FULL_44_16]OGQ47661.1 MAG: phosphate ABC transporter substrate-binding protein PstS [Deltaproteobacteria bacterium RIFCSPLOWO2_02_FULL_44_10]